MRTFKKTALASAFGTLLLTGLYPAAGHAQMPDWGDVSVSIGGKAWITQWSTWFTEFNFAGRLIPNSDRLIIDFASGNIYNRTADTETAFIPQLSIRSGQFLVTGSAFTNKSYTFGLNTATLNSNSDFVLQEVELKRKEYDINAGWIVSPNLVLLVGYKDWRNESSNGSYEFRGKGPTLGAAVSTPIVGGLNFYGNMGYGWPKVTSLSSSSAFFDVEGSGRGKYLLGEVGVSYNFAQMNESLRGLTVTAGYRYQKLQSSRVTLPTYFINSDGTFNRNTPIGEREVTLTDVTEGPTLGAVYTF